MPSSESAPVEASLDLMGLWLHEPTDPEGTAENYLYGKSTRSTAITLDGVGRRYAGRASQVFDFGEHQDTVVQVSVDVPNGDDWAAQLASLQHFATSRHVLCLRDNRGRRVFGVLSDYQEADADFGTRVTFRFTSADYTEAVA